MRVVVTGAAGYVGAALVRRLLEAGHSVAALARRPLPGPPRAGLEITQGDVRDARVLDAVARDGDAVAHLAAYVHRPAASPAELRECFSVNVDGTRAVLAAIERAGRRPQFVFVSTISVYGAAFENIREDAACAPANAYGASKLAAEGLVRDAVARGVVRGTVLRSAVVFGPGAPGNVDRLRRLLQRGLWPQIAGGRNRKSLVHVDDLVEVLALALVRGSPESVYNVAAAPPVTMQCIAQALADGRRVWRMPVPGVIASAAARALALAGRFAAGPLAGLARSLDTFVASTTVDTALLARDFQVRFRGSEAALRSLASGP